MARNWIQFQKGCSLTQFMEDYGTDDRSHAQADKAVLHQEAG